MSQVLATRLAVRIEDPDEPFLREAGDVAVAFINLSFPESESGSAKKAPHYPKKTAGEPGLLRSEEGALPEPESLTTPTELPASLPQLGEGQQQRSPAVGAAGSDVPRSRLVSYTESTVCKQPKSIKMVAF